VTVKRTEVYLAQRLQSPFYSQTPDAAVSKSTLAGLIKKSGAKWGAAGVKAVKAAYDQARTKAGKDPSYNQIRAELRKAQSSLSNERAKGRVNDGYVDDREAAAVKSPVAKEVYAYLSAQSKVSAPADAKVHATMAQLGKAYDKLSDVVDDAFKKFKTVPNGNYPELIWAMRSEAKKAGIGAQGVAALVIATNGVTGRGDNGSLTDGGNSLPKASEVKHALKNARTKLVAADGAAVVNFEHAEKAPVSKNDGVITGLEVDRTPLVQGKAAHAFLAYAGSL
jgi:hypothetical protein